MNIRLQLTCYTSQKLPSKTLNMAVGEGHKVVVLEEIKDTLTQKRGDDADMATIIKTINAVNASIFVCPIVVFQCSKNSKFIPCGLAVWPRRSNNLHCDKFLKVSVVSLDNLAKGAFAEESAQFV